MFFKQSLILLFVSIFASAIAADLEDYDIESLRNMLRAQINCPNAYAAYYANCTQNYKNQIRKCEQTHDESKSKLDAEALENRKKFIAESDSSCGAINQCDQTDSNIPSAFSCLAETTGLASAVLTSKSYVANNLQSEYISQEQNLREAQDTCNNVATQKLSSKNEVGMKALSKCFGSNNFDAVEPVVPVDPQPNPEPTPEPEVTTVSKEPVTPEVTTERPEVSESPTPVPTKPEPVTEENAIN